MPERVALQCRGIIFDVGDILYDASAWRRWLTNRLVADGVRISYPELVERWEAQLVDVYRGRAEYWDRFAALLDEVALEQSRREAVASEARRMADDVQVDRQPMTGVPETLERLKAVGLRLAALSDTESGEERVRALLRQIGIEQYFDAVVTSADIGLVKPDTGAYRAAADALGLAAEDCAFVGHDIDELEGALSAGITAVAFNYHPDAPADVYIDDFTELLDAISTPLTETDE